MGEMDTDTFGLIVLIASVVAVFVAARREPRKARQDAPASENHVWRDALQIFIVTALPAAMGRATRRSQGTSPPFPCPPMP
jgi:hypothetical protein